MGELLEIWLKKLHGEPMISLTETDVIAGEGIAILSQTRGRSFVQLHFGRWRYINQRYRLGVGDGPGQAATSG